MVNKTAQGLLKNYGNPNRVELDTKTKEPTKMVWYNVVVMV